MIDEYLSLLGLTRRAPSVEYLRDLHRAHVAKVVYSNLDILLGQAGGLDPAECVARVLARRGGYCFQLNSALAWLLRELGFSVTFHRGYVVRRDGSQPGLNHLALVVHDLGEVPWLVDAGLGDAIYEPLPLVPGVYVQGPFRYELGPATDRDGWRLTHDVTGSFTALEFASAASALADFADAHTYWSTSPESSFTQFLTAQVRTAYKSEGIRALTVITADADGRRSHELHSFADWLGYLTGLGLAAEPLERMWEPTLAHHHEWVTSS